MLTYEEFLKQRALADEALVVMTAEDRTAIRNLPVALGPRFIDLGICEQTLIGAAAGLALRGRTPIAHAPATFLTMRAFEFIRTDVGIPRLPVTLVGSAPGFLSEASGTTHQALEDVALMRGIPGMQVFCPADREELVQGMAAVLDSRAPTYVRYAAGEAAVEHHEPFVVGKAETIAAGSDVALLVYGFLLGEAAAARVLLEARGISVRLVNLRMPKPVDEEAIVAAACETRLVVTIEDHFLTGGLYSIVAEVLLKHRRSARVLPLALEERWFEPAPLSDVLAHEGFDAGHIAKRVERAFREAGADGR
jgi:transketolase